MDPNGAVYGYDCGVAAEHVAHSAAAGLDQLPDTLLLAMLMTHYSYFERRLESVVRPSDVNVQDQIANAAVSFLLNTCDADAATRIESRRAELVATVIAQRTALNESLFDLARQLERRRRDQPADHPRRAGAARDVSRRGAQQQVLEADSRSARSTSQVSDAR